MEVGEILLVLAAVAVGFFAKGVTGLGGPPLAIPVLASFMGVEYAVAVIAIPAALANFWLMIENRSVASDIRWFLVPMMATGVVGTLLGVWLLLNIDDQIMSVLLGVFMLLYIIWYFLNPERQIDNRTARRLAAPAGFGAGVLAGATGISAPVVGTYVHSLRLARSGFVFAVAAPFFFLGLMQIASLAALGGYDRARVAAGIIACIPVVVVTPIAMRVGRRLSVQAFQYAVLVVLGIAAFRLLWSGLA
jgi:uncharacterized membrane protein YfcA